MNTLADILSRAYKETPDRTAIILQQAGQDDQAWSYRVLLDQANAYATAYAREGLSPGEVIILILPHGPDLIFSFWGAILHGAIPSIMPFLTEKLSPERYRADLAALIQITKPAAVVTYREFEAEVRGALQPGDSVRAVIVIGRLPPAAAPDFGRLGGAQRLPEEIALLQHSSGTTGLQKGVALSHGAVIKQLGAYRKAIRLDPDTDVIVSWLPLYHDMGLIACFLLPVLLGVPVVMMSPFDWVRAPYRLMQAITQYKGTLAWLPNFAYNFCAQKIRDRNMEGVDLSTVRALINCSEPVRAESHRMFFEKFSGFGLRKEALHTSYAMAENVFAVTQSLLESGPVVDMIDREAFMSERIARRPVDGRAAIGMMSSGRPIEDTQVRILDEAGQPAAERAVGEIAVLSDYMLSSYYNRPDATGNAFRDGWYLTGDYGYLADGELFVSGRKKDLIIVGGRNIYPQDLESLAGEVPGVHPGRVVAFGVFDDETGTEDAVIIAEVDSVDAAEHEKIADSIRQHVTKSSAIALRHVRVVGPRWILKTSSGKTARAANREKFIRELEAPAD